MDSVSKQQYATPFFLCPNAKFRNEEDEFRWTQFGELPILSDAEHKSSSSSSSSHIRPLDRGNKMNGKYFDTCAVCKGITFHIDPQIYFCKVRSCRVPAAEFISFPAAEFISFHRVCIEPISNHPYHPKHYLRLIHTYPSKICLCCSKFLGWVYNCSICDFSMCRDCSRKPPVLAIDHPKRHEHTLLYNYRKSSLICDVCALSDHRSLMYSCGQCDFVVHKECVYFPYVIRISRHEHRLSFDSSLTPEKWSCGVCHRKIDTNYGRYSCVKGCSYGAHSKCATREDIWDGEELEGKPEDEYEDIRSFIEISDGIILHFSHQSHHMKLDEKTDRAFDESKHCQACTLPICDEIIYSCMGCDFILHQECAHLPRKKHQVTHPHPLSLQVDHRQDYKFFRCKACKRFSNGFAYLCYKRGCDYMLDVRCASIAEPLDHRCHPDPLFLTFEPRSEQICSICHKSRGHRLNCGKCGFVVCFRCATLPNKLRDRHDEHSLIFSYDEDVSSQYLCEVCEKEADPKNGVYICNDCNVTLHIQCLLGKDMYMRPGGVVHYGDVDIPILLNNGLTRNKCKNCHNRCEGKKVYKISDRKIFCSFKCLDWWCEM